MTFEDFQALLKNDMPPPGLNPLLLALWYDGKGEWESSHNIASEIHNDKGSLLHAYLHRREGDIWNADYWCRQAGTKRREITLEEEWESLVRKFL